MKTVFSTILVGLALSTSQLSAWPEDENGITFFHGTWKEAIAKAAKENKQLFVDFYADWCGPCKQMTKDVFTDAKVGAYFNANVISVKINAEKDEADFVKEMKIEAYPTLAVFDFNGTVLAKNEGALNTEDLLKFIRVHSDFDKSRDAYRQDSSSMEKFTAYIGLLRFKDPTKSSSEVSRFMNRLTLDQLKTKEAWDLVVNNLDDVKSDAFRLLCENAAWFKSNHENFNDAYLWFINTMMQKALEEKDDSFIRVLKDRYLAIRKSTGSMIQSEAYYEQAIDLAYRKQKGDSTYVAEMLSMVAAFHGKDWKVLDANILDALQSDLATPADKRFCLTLARNALKLNSNALTNWTLAAAQQANPEQKNSQANAKKYLMEALKKATPEQLSLNSGSGVTLSIEGSDNAITSIFMKL